ncbi:MAG: chemotaxis protein CheD [Deltaproteobacteria bacterium]|nr:chemotaxis protein CheD [Deltaproteobacteria bacterium]
MKNIILDIGDIVVPNEPAILETILGSCVSTCLWDEKLHIGGMNHFMLPKITRDVKSGCVGTESIKQLVNALLKMGSNMKHVRAKLFGGNRVIQGFSYDLDVGRENVRIAKDMLKEYKIPIINEFIQQDYGIKLVFHTDTGKAFIKELSLDVMC